MPGYGRDMTEIWLKYCQRMAEIRIRLRCGYDLFEIWPRYVRDMDDTWLRYVKDMAAIWLRYY